MEPLQIFIPTFGRSENQVTWNNLPPNVQKHTRLVVQTKEALANVKAYDSHGAGMILLPEWITSISPTRQYLVDSFGPYILMLDDDLDFAVRRADEPTKFTPATGRDITHMVDTIHEVLIHGREPLVGVSAREGANYDTSQFKFATRQLRVHGVDTEIFKEKNIRYDRIPFMEDFDVTLQVLEAGYTNRVLNGWVHNQRGGSNAKGGCSGTRTPKKQEEAARRLKELHPDFVTVVSKISGNWDGGNYAERYDVRISWKKAHNEHHKS